MYATLFGVQTRRPGEPKPAAFVEDPENGAANFDFRLSQITNMRHVDVAAMAFLSGTEHRALAELWENRLWEMVSCCHCISLSHVSCISD